MTFKHRILARKFWMLLVGPNRQRWLSFGENAAPAKRFRVRFGEYQTVED